MPNRINVKLVLELRDAGLSRNMIAATRHIGKDSVSDVLHRADELAIIFADVKDKDNDEIYKMFYPDKQPPEGIYKDPDYLYVHDELKKVGVTLKLLWEEYRDKCRTGIDIPMGYTKYCEGYSAYTVRNNVTNHLIHKPAIIAEVDWSGPTMEYLDDDSGELVKVYLFVGTLPYSQYAYVEPCLDMKEDTWLRCHVRMFAYYGGSTARIVCDNLKTGVIEHPREGDIVLNGGYEDLGNHYMTAIMPTGVRKPKQKASVEGTVGKIATAIIAKLRGIRFHSFDDLKVKVAGTLRSFNAEPFQKRASSRLEVFTDDERDILRPLPIIPFEIAKWSYKHLVGNDCHVIYARNHYSCSYKYVRLYADLKVTDTSLAIFINDSRVASHTKYPDYVTDGWSTHPEDLPEQFNKPEWNDARIRERARAIGEYTAEVVDRIFKSMRLVEQGYGPTLSVLRLATAYSQQRLEYACGMVLKTIRVPRYHHLKAILSSGQDVSQREIDTSRSRTDDEGGAGYVRGADYYRGRSER
jgi:transposase